MLPAAGGTVGSDGEGADNVRNPWPLFLQQYSAPQSRPFVGRAGMPAMIIARVAALMRPWRLLRQGSETMRRRMCTESQTARMDDGTSTVYFQRRRCLDSAPGWLAAPNTPKQCTAHALGVAGCQIAKGAGDIQDQ